jgi:hypothetical protein
MERPHGSLLGPLATAFVLGGGVHVGMTQEFLHGDQIAISTTEIASDRTPKAMRTLYDERHQRTWMPLDGRDSALVLVRVHPRLTQEGVLIFTTPPAFEPHPLPDVPRTPHAEALKERNG